MSEIKYEIVKKIGVLSKAGSGLGEDPLRPALRDTYRSLRHLHSIFEML